MSDKRPTVLSCVNLKGGVGKTAVAVNFSAYCGLQGFKTLLVDLDPQTNATFCCMSLEKWQEWTAEHGSVANLLGYRQHTSAEGKDKDAKDIVIPNVFKNVDLIPSHTDLFTIDLDLGAEVARETKLRRAMKELITNYDLVVCDCPPNLTIPTQNALAMSTHYVVPVSPDFLSSIGVGLLISRIKKFSEDLENPVRHAGIVMSRVGRPSIFRSQTIGALRQTFGEKVLSSQINERSSVSEAAAKNLSIFSMNDSMAIGEFKAFGAELLTELGLG